MLLRVLPGETEGQHIVRVIAIPGKFLPDGSVSTDVPCSRAEVSELIRRHAPHFDYARGARRAEQALIRMAVQRAKAGEKVAVAEDIRALRAEAAAAQRASEGGL